ncbi:HAD family hydrolase [Conchiformibius kuhniae]|uniref:HAD family hydrolase n=1 Tax=Conchiformibius kuhniae TaxID=211502 RepID=A0A8T9MU40_9NEIS|nr:HAD family hydrolase [Conchiformibius kuhniae]UOP04345.1 HAD-IB family hydrolase [Conchiformibius kuhniae]
MTRLAIFDLDHTMIATDSDHAFTEFLIEQGLLDAAEAAARNQQFYQDYCNGCLNIHEYLAFQLRALRDVLPAERDRLHRQFMREKITPHLRDKARATVERHRRNGDELLVISSTNEFIITPICAAFGIGEVIGTALVCDERGCFSGEIDGVPSLGEGKIVRLQQWLHARGKSRADYETVYFYSDSKNDLPLLRHADVAVAVNPDDTLRQTAQAEGWQIEDWR